MNRLDSVAPCPAPFPAHAGMNRTSLSGFSGFGAFPAHAGMNRRRLRRDRVTGAVPRARGDEPASNAVPYERTIAFPAHAGMNRSFPAVGTVAVEPFPAHAGMNRTEGCHADCHHARSPRTRG